MVLCTIRAKQSLPTPSAFDLFRASCALGEPAGCTNLGSMYQAGNGTSKDPARAIEHFIEGCDGGDDVGCYALGKVYEAGDGVPVSLVDAAELYDRACWGLERGGLPDARTRLNEVVKTAKKQCTDKDPATKKEIHDCVSYGYLHELGLGVPQSFPKAIDLDKKTCDSGRPLGCTARADKYMRAIGVPRDFKRAAELYKMACDKKGAAGCNDLGHSHAMGDGVPKDEKKAAALFRKSCDMGNEVACKNLERLREKQSGKRPPVSPRHASARQQLMSDTAADGEPSAIMQGVEFGGAAHHGVASIS